MTDPSKISELIERSSLGTAGAHSLRQRTPPAVAQKILDRAAEHGRASAHVAAIDEFVQCWAQAILDTSYISMCPDELVERLLGLTYMLVDAALAADFDPSIPRQVGTDLVGAYFTGVEALSETLGLVSEQLPKLLDGQSSHCPDLASRIARLCGDIAVGYASALRVRTLDEQEAIHRAGLLARMEAEEVLAASEARFRAMFIQAAIGIGIADLEGNILDANPALLRMFGYTREEFRGLNVRSLAHPEDRASALQAYEELARGERDCFRMEKRYHRRDGNEIGRTSRCRWCRTRSARRFIRWPCWKMCPNGVVCRPAGVSGLP